MFVVAHVFVWVWLLLWVYFVGTAATVVDDYIGVGATGMLVVVLMAIAAISGGYVGVAIAEYRYGKT